MDESCVGCGDHIDRSDPVVRTQRRAALVRCEVAAALAHVAGCLRNAYARIPAADVEHVEADARTMLVQLVAYAEAESAGLADAGRASVLTWGSSGMEREDPDGLDYWRAWDGACAELVRSGMDRGGSAQESGLSLFSPLKIAAADGFGLSNAPMASCCAQARALAGALDRSGGVTVERRLGALHESLLQYSLSRDEAGEGVVETRTGGRRSKRGVFYTSGTLLGHVAEESIRGLEGRSSAAVRVCDPSCGSGNILLAVVRRCAEVLSHHDAGSEVLESLLADGCYGADIDRQAVDICRYSCWYESGGNTRVAVAVGRHIVWGDALSGVTPRMLEAGRAADDADAGRPVHWHLRFPEVFAGSRGPVDPRTGWSGGFDIVCGNPPFLSQLAVRTATSRPLARFNRARYPSSKTYTDPSTLFLILASELACRGGRIVMVQPESVLATRDSEAARAELAGCASLDGLWVSAGDRLFDAAVDVCVVSLSKDTRTEWALRRSSGARLLPLPERRVCRQELRAERTWSWLAAVAHRVPEIATGSFSLTLGDLAEFTADFRDQYYGLIPYVGEADGTGPNSRPLVTVGLIDLAHNKWGEVQARFGKERYACPTVSSRVMDDPALGCWARQRTVVKVLVATQTKVLECVADAEGSLLPSVPVVSAVPVGCTVWELAAAIGSPVASAVACERWLGAGMSSGILKASARQLKTLPAPCDAVAWRRAGELFRAAQILGGGHGRIEALEGFGLAACASYDLGDEETRALMQWWLPRAAR